MKMEPLSDLMRRAWVQVAHNPSRLALSGGGFCSIARAKLEQRGGVNNPD
ncbi:MAG TPA: hypothetical protein VMH85_06815 [Terriglobales bacterium]|nr:hypothetical protein [Terriglobales bacterium]